MKIDVFTGDISVLGLQIFKDLTLNRFVEILNNKNIVYKIDDMKNGWKWIRIYNQRDEDYFVTLCISFFNSEISTVEFYFSEDGKENTWENMNKDNEILKVKKMNMWIDNNIGEDRKYPWGLIWSEIEGNNMCCSSGIRYKK